MMMSMSTAPARLAFHRLECAAAHQKFRAVFAKHLREGDAVGLVPFRVNDIDAPPTQYPLGMLSSLPLHSQIGFKDDDIVNNGDLLG